MKPTALSARLDTREQQRQGQEALGVVIIPAGTLRQDWRTYIQAYSAELTGRGGLIVIPAKSGLSGYAHPVAGARA